MYGRDIFSYDHGAKPTKALTEELEAGKFLP